MKNFLRFAVLPFFVGSSAFGANGSNMIGISPVSTGMGGTGVANYNSGTDAIYKNPSMLLEMPSAGGNFTGEMSSTIIKNSTAANAGGGLKNSLSGAALMPNLAVGYKLNEDLAFGLGTVTFGGAALDYTGEATLLQVKTQMALMKIMPAVAYRVTPEIMVGVSPFMTYGTLASNESTGGTQSTRQPDGTTGIGGQIGVGVMPTPSMRLGLTYTSKATLNFNTIIDFDRFGPNAANAALLGEDNVKIQTPDEIAFGVAYDVTPAFTATFDYRHIGWHRASTFKELGWDDQNVFAVGGEYRMDSWKFRGGFNYAKAPVGSVTGEVGTNVVDFQGHSVFAQSISNLNVVGYAPFAQTHLTAGIGYQLNDNWNFDGAVQIVPKTTVTRSGTTLGTPYTYTAEVSQWAVSAGAGYKF